MLKSLERIKVNFGLIETDNNDILLQVLKDRTGQTQYIKITITK